MAGPPNLVLVVLDTARADEGLRFDRLPGMAGLAARGTTFRRAISPAPWTLPAHGSLFSGLLPHQHGLTGDVAVGDGGVRPVEGHIRALEDRWLPSRLRAAGYRTFAASANPWITRPMGFGMGFDRFVETWRSARNPRFRVEGSARGRPRSRFLPPPLRGAAARARKVWRFAVGRGDSGARASLAAFRGWLEAGEAGRPFFAFFNFMEPHLPLLPHRGFGPGGLRHRLAASRLNRTLSNEFVIRHNVGRADVSPAALELLRELYRGEMAYLDARLAELGALVDPGETLIAVVGDHGENLGEHHLLGHQASLADTLLRVPLVLSGPQALAGRGEVREAVSTARVPATLAGAAGLPSEGPTLLDRGPQDAALAWYESAYVEAARARSLAEGELADDPAARSILTWRGWAAHRGPHKLVARSDGSRALFDVEADPGETRDLAAERPDLVAELERLALPLEPEAAGEPTVPGRELAEIEQHLESLGYL